MTGAALSGKKYKAYPEYKESGVEWVGEIPSDWSMWKLAHAFNEIGSGTTPPTNNEKWFKGDVPWITTGELREKIITDTKKKLSPSTLKAFPTLKKYPVGSIAIAMYGATIGRLGIFGVEAATNQACCVMTTSTQLNNKYLFYWLWAFKEDIIRLSSGGGQPNINQEKVASLRVSAPKSKEQQKIASFLDHETAKIDTLIAKQEKLIELLKEKRQAVISHAVTKGLNPNAPMRDSGVEWLGEVPEHWDIPRIKQIVDIPVTDGPHETPTFVDSGVPFVSAEAVSKGVVDFKKIRGFITEQQNAIYSNKYSPRIYDIYMVKSGATTGVTAIVETNEIFNIWSPLAVIRCKKNYYPYFVLNFLRSHEFLKAVELNWSFGTQQNIGMGVIENLHIACPPKEEAIQIASYLQDKMARFETLVGKANKQIYLMKERKTALISAAVTGKIDVRDFVSEQGQPQGV